MIKTSLRNRSRRGHRRLGLEGLEVRHLLAANPIITEFMADNGGPPGLADGSIPPRYEDWIEVYNDGDTGIDLAGWHLTDNAANLGKWTFPSRTLPPRSFLVVFASGNDTPDAASNLHTNFRLATEGEYLALVRPDLTIASEFGLDGEDYPRQRANVSYGLGQDRVTTPLVSRDATGRLLVQTSDGGLGTAWTGGDEPFADAAWTEVVTGIGYKAPGTPPGGSTPAVFDPATGHYMQLVTTQTSWTAARTNAPALSLGGVPGHLATLRSGAENAFATARLAGASAWIGAHDQSTEGNWEWVDAPGQPFCVGNGNCSPQGGAFTSWNGGEPNDVNGEDVAQLLTNGAWNDLPATSNQPYLVEFDTVPAGYFTVRQVKSAGGAFADMDAALAVLNAATNGGESTGRFAGLDFVDPGFTQNGHYPGNVPFPLNSAADDDNFVIRATGTLDIPTAGNWTFGAFHDDNVRLILRGDNGFTVTRDGGCCGDHLFTVNLPAAGFYDLELIHYENNGQAHLELFGAQGSLASFTSAFKLIGDVRNGGLALSTFGNLFTTDIQPLMRNVNASALLRLPFNVADPAAFDAMTLRMSYDDGFVAYLNGTEVARRNAPATIAWNSAATTGRSDELVSTAEEINVSAFLGDLRAGTNILAIQGLNVSAGDTDFVLLPELEAFTVTTQGNRYFSTPTPGAFNSQGGVIDFVADLEFSQPHGFYDAPFQLTITSDTPDVAIRYTTDGKLPTATTGSVYSGPLTIGATSVIRAAAFKPGFQSAPVETATYLFLDDVIRQSPTGQAPPGWPTTWGANTVNYGMDPDVIGPNDLFNNLYENTIKDDLKSIPAWSIVMNLDDLFGGQGIYANPGGEGRAWERAASFEVFDGLGREEGFQANGGLRIRGGFSRSTSNPKHSFRLFFREEYGDAKLQYPLFGDEGVDEFDGFDLRTSQNYSWAFQGDAANVMNRDVWSRDAQRDMGQPYTRSRYYHVFINGQYWGLYQTQERSEASFAASYFGGNKEDYDVVKAENYNATVATDGNLNAAAAFYDLFHTQLTTATTDAQRFALYMRMQGMNVDGTPNPAYPKYLDVDNTIDYMFVIFFSGNSDGPILGGGGGPNNFFGIYNRVNPDGFKWFAHDSEHTLDRGAGDRTGPFNNIGAFDDFNPQYLWQQLLLVPQFRLRVADRLHEHYHNDGALTTANALGRFLARKAEIDRAIVGESARWGDAQRATPFTRDVEWVNAINNLVNYFNSRSSPAFNQLVADGLYPSIEVPDFYIDGRRQHGGAVPVNAELTIALGQGGQNYNDTVLMPANTAVRAFVPTAASAVDTTWFQEGFSVPAAWGTGTYGVGYDTAADYRPLINVDTQATMLNLRTGVYIRSTFTWSGTDDFDRLLLRMKYDDGFVAYLNGVKVLTVLGPATAAWNSAATANHEANANQFEDFDISAHLGLLHAGTNVLAIHGMNVNTGSSDLIFVPELSGGVLIPSGTAKPVYITTDGSDPRLINGSISPSATLYTAPLILDESAVVKARTFDTATQAWSAITETTYSVAMPVRVTELMYHPQAPTGGPHLEDDFEFLEIQNVGVDPINLSNLRFVDGVQFDFATSSVPTLAAGERAVIVKNLTAFQSRYGTSIPVAGVYTGSLANEGETVTLADALGGVIQTFDYDDDWFDATDGRGFSLAIKNPADDPELWSTPAAWQVSYRAGGSPTESEAALSLAPGSIVINEVIEWSFSALGDRFELFNTTAAPIDISGWYLSDDPLNATKYRLGTLPPIQPGGYVALTEASSFGGSFSLSPAGGELILQAADAAGAAIGFQAAQNYGGSDPGMSQGRHAKPDGDVDFTPLVAQTPNGPNAEPAIGPVVITEVMYHPAASSDEFVELQNIAGDPVSLAGWSFSAGLDFVFGDVTLDPGQYVLVVPMDPAVFRTAHNIPVSVAIVGPYVGALDNAGEELKLVRPGSGGGNVLVDRANYKDASPWPASPDGQGPTLAKLVPATYGNLASHWGAGIPGGTPGGPNLFYDETPPTAPSGLSFTALAGPTIALSWSASVDPQSGVAEYVIYRNGVQIAASTATSYIDTPVAINTAYSYQVAARNHSGVASLPTAALAAKILDIASVVKVDATHVRVTFTEAVSAATAQATANYFLGGLSISAAVLQAGNTAVLLTTSTITDGQPYRITVTGVESTVGGAKLIPGTQRVFTPGMVNGLAATYYDDLGPAPDYVFQGTSVERTDSSLSFVWLGTPHPSIASDTFGVRWRGRIEPVYSQLYTFYFQMNDGGRFWIDTNGDGEFADSERVINRWSASTATTTETGTVALTAGRLYNIQVEMFDLTTTAMARLEWESASQLRQFVPSARLFTPTPSVESTSPHVAAIHVGGSGWSAPFTAAVQTAGLGIGGVAVPLGGESPILPWSNVDRISMRFDEDVDVGLGDLVVTGATTGNLSVSDFSYDPRTYTAQWTLAAPLSADRVTIELAAGATDLAGNAFAGAVSAVVRSLPGDADANGTVNAADFQANRLAQFTALGQPLYSIFHDTDANGAINILDWHRVLSSVGTSLPAPSPAPEAVVRNIAATIDRGISRTLGGRRALDLAAIDHVMTAEARSVGSLSSMRARRKPAPFVRHGE